jgi:hypothetical protein
MAKTYAEKLQDPRWQKKRLECLEDSGWACSLCGSDDKTLHVHHKGYIRGREPWDYKLDELAVLCETCHQDTHKYRTELDLLLDQCHPSELPFIVGRLRASAGVETDQPFQLDDCEMVSGAVSRFDHRGLRGLRLDNRVIRALKECSIDRATICEVIERFVSDENKKVGAQ